VKETSPP